MINGGRRFQTYTVARTFALCLAQVGDPFADEVVAGVGIDRAFVRRFCRLSNLSHAEVRVVLRRIDNAKTSLTRSSQELSA